jgi:hypothetical protein
MLSLSLGLSLTSGQGVAAGAAFDPASLFDSDTGYVFDLSDGTSVFQETSSHSTASGNGDPIGTLLDLSGNGNHVVALADQFRPTYVTDGSVGYADFLSNGVDVFHFIQGMFTLEQPGTFVLSVRINAGAVENDHFADGGSAFTALFAVGSGPDLLFYGGSNLIGSGQNFSLGDDFVATAIADGAFSKVALNANAFSEGTAGSDDANGATFGSDAQGNNFPPMRLYRAIGIGRILTDQEIADARAWCAAPAGVSL